MAAPRPALPLTAAILFAAAPARADHELLVGAYWQLVVIGTGAGLAAGRALVLRVPRAVWIAMPVIVLVQGLVAWFVVTDEVQRHARAEALVAAAYASPVVVLLAMLVACFVPRRAPLSHRPRRRARVKARGTWKGRDWTTADKRTRRRRMARQRRARSFLCVLCVLCGSNLLLPSAPRLRMRKSRLDNVIEMF